MAILQSDLLRYANKHIITESLENFSKRASTGIRAFLCHSHQDAQLAEGVQKLFKEKGIDVYIDWQDATMPETPDAQTAQNIKNRISASPLFFFLATQNSIVSRWCPWEIGYADNSSRRIFIIPTQDTAGHAHGNEYLQLYSKIDIGSASGRSDYAVFAPDGSGKWISTEAFR